MAAVDVSETISALETTMGSIENVLDLPDMRLRAAALEEEASAPDLWDDQAKAQVVTSKLSFLQGEIRKAEALRSRLDDMRSAHDARTLWNRGNNTLFSRWMCSVKSVTNFSTPL